LTNLSIPQTIEPAKPSNGGFITPPPNWSRSIGTGGRNGSVQLVAIVGMRMLPYFRDGTYSISPLSRNFFRTGSTRSKTGKNTLGLVPLFLRKQQTADQGTTSSGFENCTRL
jgi:hypothetical protein